MMQINPKGPEKGDWRITRGSWLLSGCHCVRPSLRNADVWECHSAVQGFRVVLEFLI